MACPSTGRIKSFSTKNGYGFITDVPDSDEDVFFGKEHVPAEWQLGAQEIIGREVTFDLSTNQDGKPQARNIKPAGPPPTGSRTLGTVKSWNTAKGFGFMRVAGLDGDIFFARDRLPNECREVNRMDGLTFSFELSETPDGKYQAHHMQSVGGQSVQMQPQLTTIVHNGLSGVKRPMHNGEMGNAKRSFNRPDMNGRFTGTVKSYSVKNGYGFIVTSQLQEDIVIYSKELDDNMTELQPNNEVEFSIRYGNSGRPQAYDVVMATTGIAAPMCTSVTPSQRSFTPQGAQREYPALTVDELKLYTALLTTKDLGDLAAYTTQMLQTKLGQNI
eukprot:GEMP01036429.1.p1 GENE.GEMP01036429.1~~GEMP01036429.1.p1  ORF type:complete len:337 (+),score=63.53 GEMP01036429.1:22-1011(+)